ncbi:COR domain-containing protein, partial [Arcanobacterium phocae]
ALEKDTRNHIYLEDFDEICHEHNITEERDIDTLLGYFHDLGIILHFAENSLLRERVILKPQWATNAIYRLFDHDIIKMKEGRFTRRDCAGIWTDKQYRHSCGILIELMKKFQLVSEIGNTGNLVAPQMLPESTPVYPWENKKNSQMQFRYDLFMPRGIFWQFIVTMYSYIEKHEWVWRNGAIFRRDGARAEVIEN